MRTDGNSRTFSQTDVADVADRVQEPEILAERLFLRTLCLERKRTERTRRPFVLMLLDCTKLVKAGKGTELLPQVLRSLSTFKRETDAMGWYQERSVIGVIFTEISLTDRRSIVNALLTKVTNAFGQILSIDQINEVSLSFHVFPDEFEKQEAGSPDEVLYPDVRQGRNERSSSRIIKRAIDILGSVLALVLFSPLLLIIAVAVRLTSGGPVLFRQKRLGQYRKPFTCLKFRSMHAGNDPSIHEAYIKWLIAGTEQSSSSRTVFKLTDDPRITRVGKILRKTSLDELPQFLNVFLGQMSLVGPRPPIPYEYQAYDLWHQCRLLAVKPGITGLWQVSGRSKLKFDEMVRLDLQYIKQWSLWLDIKIILRTPFVVLTAHGAY